MELDVLYNEDCLEGMKRIPDGSVDMILCDLPYAVTQNHWDSVIPFEPLWEQYKRVTKPNAVIVLTASQPFTSKLVCSNVTDFKYALVWDKIQVTGFLNARKQPLRRHEDVLVFYRSQPTYNPQFSVGKPYSIDRKHASDNYGQQSESRTVNGGLRYPTTLCAYPQIREKSGHPTQKPVALFEYLIRTYTDEDETVLDSCIGSGTTSIACMNTGRRYIGFEKDPVYFAIAQKRIAKHAPQLSLVG